MSGTEPIDRDKNLVCISRLTDTNFTFIKGQNVMPDVTYLAVSEKGLKLLKREKITEDLAVVKEYE